MPGTGTNRIAKSAEQLNLTRRMQQINENAVCLERYGAVSIVKGKINMNIFGVTNTSVNGGLTAGSMSGLAAAGDSVGSSSFAEEIINVRKKAETAGSSGASEAEEMEIFKKDFYMELLKITKHGTVSGAAVNISEEAFEKMKADPQYREQVLNLIKRDWGSSYMPRSCSVLITVGSDINDYRADSWSDDNDNEFRMYSKDSFYKSDSKKEKERKAIAEKQFEAIMQHKRIMKKMLNAQAEKKVSDMYVLHSSDNIFELL